MPLSDAESQLVRSLASEGRWPELVTRLQSERSGETVLHLAGVLREIGADCLTAGKWAEAAVCYRLAQWPVNYGAELAFRPEQLQEFYLSFYELIVKSDEAVANGTAQGADFWDSLTAVVTSLAAAGHFAEAEYILMRLQNGPDREWAERLEDVAAKLPLPDQAERADWLLRQAKYGYSLYASLDSATSEYWERQSERVREKVLEIEGLAAAQDENEEIVEEDQAGEGRQEVEDGNAPTLPADAFARLAELTRNREFDERADLLDDEYSPFREQIAGHFQAEGDRFRERGQLAAALDAYSVAIQASEDKSRLSAVVQNLRKADLDNKMENAIPDESIVVVTGWENGLDRVVWLALRGRTEDADDLLAEMRRKLPEAKGDLCVQTGDEYLEVTWWFKEIAEHVRAEHPNTAVWFHKKWEDGLFAFLDRPARTEQEASIGPLLVRMESWLAENRPDYFENLQPGISEGQLSEFEREFGLKLPSTFRELYQWRNGQRLDSFESLAGNRMLMPLEDIADTKRGLDGMIGSDFTDPTHWRRGWVPFLANGAGDHLCVDITAEDGGSPGQLREFWHADEDRPVEYDNLREWLSVLVESMDDGTIEIF